MFERVWGGNHLDALYGKPIPPGKIIGESWELSDRPDAQSIVDSGEFDGWTLRQLLEKYPREMLGKLPDRARFPLLVKYVDAGDKLSVQVHPDDDGAKQFNDLGKSECWVVVHAEPGAQIVRGLKPGTTREDFARAVEENRVEELLHYFEPQTGDVIALPPGTVHAIGAGLVVAEVQQNSDVTLRIYDYNRMGLDGKPRALHIKEALEAIRFDGRSDEFTGDMHSETVKPTRLHPCCEHLLNGRYFDLVRLTLSAESMVAQVDANQKQYRHLEIETKGRTTVVMVLEGQGVVCGRVVKPGMTGLIPAAMTHAQFVPLDNLTLLLAMPK